MSRVTLPNVGDRKVLHWSKRWQDVLRTPAEEVVTVSIVDASDNTYAVEVPGMAPALRGHGPLLWVELDGSVIGFDIHEVSVSDEDVTPVTESSVVTRSHADLVTPRSKQERTPRWITPNKAMAEAALNGIAQSIGRSIDPDDGCPECGYAFGYEDEGCDECRWLTEVMAAAGLTHHDGTRS